MSTLSPDRWQEISPHLDHALSLPEDERAARENFMVGDPHDESTMPLDYYIFPSIDVHGSRVRLAEENHIDLDTYRCASLDYLFGMAEQVSVEAAA